MIWRLIWVTVLLISMGCHKDIPQETSQERPKKFSNFQATVTPSSPKRIVSLAPNLTEFLFELGVGDRVVGVTRYCNYPVGALAKITKVGGYLDPSIETIVSLKPDLVVAMTNPGLKETLKVLQQQGINVLWLRVQTFQDVRKSYSVLGKALGIEDRAKQRLAEFDNKVSTQQARRPNSAEKPQAVIILGHRPLIVAGANTFTGELIELAGGTNVASSSKRPYPQWSAETLLRFNPEVIIDAWMGGERDQQPSDRWRQMTQIDAVRNQHVFVWKNDSLLRPGPRLPEALSKLIDLLHTRTKPSKP